MQKTKPGKLLTAFVKITGIVPAYLFMKPKVYSSGNAKKRLPKPCILMSNHTSLLDFVLYLIIFPWRNIRFLMAEVLFRKGRLFAWFLYKLGGIFVDRDIFDMDFVGEALDALEKKQTVGVFPQGRLPDKGKQFPFKPGIAYIALRTEHPIIPVYVDGNYGIFKRVRVMIGDPIYLRDVFGEYEAASDKFEEIAEYLQDKVNELKIELENRMKNKNEKE